MISHAMVNPIVIDEIKRIAIYYNGAYGAILYYVHKKNTRDNWNTQQFHQEMKAVAGNYKLCGGFSEKNINDGIAHQIFENKDNILYKAAEIIEKWLEADVSSEDDLIKNIFELKIPGMNVEIGGYWLLHFCRGVSLIRQKVLKKETVQSKLYLDMIGVKLFRDKYEDLRLEHMEELYIFCKELVSKYTNAIFTYGDFGCLCCEMHRLIDEFTKNNYQNFRHNIEYVTNNKKEEWLTHKQKTIEESKLAPSIENSARSNVNIFIGFLETIKRRQRDDN